jgi:hypothetical protein
MILAQNHLQPSNGNKVKIGEAEYQISGSALIFNFYYNIVVFMFVLNFILGLF